MNHNFQNIIEKESWENFEVGSYDDVILIQKTNQDNDFLSHLSIISSIELGDKSFEISDIKGNSILQNLALSYICNSKSDLKSASEFYEKYINLENRILTNTILLFGIQLFLKNLNYKFCLEIISLYNELNGSSNIFIKEKIECLYALKLHKELVEYFKVIHKFLDKDLEVYLKVGLSLNALGQYKEAEAILLLIKIEKNLPSYDEKKKEYTPYISKITEYENNKSKLNGKQLKDLGFAYLFNSDYKKAEEVFSKVAILQE